MRARARAERLPRRLAGDLRRARRAAPRPRPARRPAQARRLGQSDQRRPRGRARRGARLHELRAHDAGDGDADARLRDGLPGRRAEGAAAHPRERAAAGRLGRSTTSSAGACSTSPTWDIDGTPKFFPRRYHHLLQIDSDAELYDLEWMRACRYAGYPVVEIPIYPTERFGGRSTTSYSSAIRMLLGAYRMRGSFHSAPPGGVPDRRAGSARGERARRRVSWAASPAERDGRHRSHERAAQRAGGRARRSARRRGRVAARARRDRMARWRCRARRSRCWRSRRSARSSGDLLLPGSLGHASSKRALAQLHPEPHEQGALPARARRAAAAGGRDRAARAAPAARARRARPAARVGARRRAVVAFALACLAIQRGDVFAYGRSTRPTYHAAVLHERDARREPCSARSRSSPARAARACARRAARWARETRRAAHRLRRSPPRC